jgi:serine/threonine protein kinase
LTWLRGAEILDGVNQTVCASCGTAGEFAPPPAGQPAKCPNCSGSVARSGTQFGKYTLSAEIGRGSMGVVHDAQDTTLHRRVALKIMHEGRGGEPKEAVNEWQRFIQEARLTANVAKHANIVTVYEAAVQDSRRYIAMEYVAGEPMNRWRPGRSTREQVRLLRDVALAVHHAHEHGIIHRDLKPGNVLVGKGGVPVVTDFGLATYERRGVGMSLTPTGYIVGSPAYMSPEQARGSKDVDRATDIYSLGIMLYESIAGKPPFGGKNPVETLSKVVEGTKVPPSQAAPLPGNDPELDAICMKAIALEARDRYKSAAELAKALTRWLDQGKPAERSRYPVAQISTLVALSIVLAAVLFWNKRNADRREEDSQARLADMTKRLEAVSVVQAAPPAIAPLETFKQRVVSPHNGSTPAKMSFWAAGLFEGIIKVSDAGSYDVTITASCTEAKGEMAKFRLTLDDELLGDVLLTTTRQEEYHVPATVTKGEHKLGIEFTNDFYDKDTKQDRNLYVHQIALRRTR